MGRARVVRDYGGISAADRRAARRARLLAAGRQIWGESGAAEVSVRGVCQTAGLGPRYFYEHFANREALLVAVAEQVREEMFAELVVAALREPGGLPAKLYAGLKAALDILAEDRHTHRIITSLLTGTDGLAESRARALDMLTDLVLEHGSGMLDAELPDPSELRRGASFIVGGVTQLVDAWMLDPTESTAELAQDCTRLALAVVRAPAEPARTA